MQKLWSKISGQKVDEAQHSALIIGNNKLGTYAGVFRPTILTIFGVIMYIRMGWIVGNAGILGALLILLMTFTITGTAALSFSSITTNIRLKAGGVFALVSQSLGLEAGGAVGVPLYLAQSLGAALYIYGFAEGWQTIFPEHNKALVIAAVFASGLLLSLISENLALKMQAVVILGVIVAIGSMIGGFWTVEKLYHPQLWGKFKSGNMWVLFAVFFPSGTGIKVGASLSGKLKDPKKSIPLGTLAAWGIALVVYAILMFWYASIASPDELNDNYMIAVERSAWGPGVLIGLLSSCFSAMLSSLVAAPNVLAALGNHGVIPRGKFLAKESKGGTPRNAMLINGIIVGCALLLGDLNKVAALITMFFLITYATLNIVVLIEQSLGLVSFRPTFKVHILVPAIGTVCSIFAMIITNPAFGLFALSVVFGIYVYLEYRHLETPWETVRSGVFLAVADWAARKTQLKSEAGSERAWKPDVVVPIENARELQGDYRFLLSMLSPKGSLQALSIQKDESLHHKDRFEKIIQYYRDEGLYSTFSCIDSNTIEAGAKMGISILQGSFFNPNILFINTKYRGAEISNKLMHVAHSLKLGLAVYISHDQAQLGRERDINIWIRDQSPDWKLGLRLANLDLAILLGYQLNRNWKGRIHLISAISKPEHVEPARKFLRNLSQDARLPGTTEITVFEGEFENAITKVERADLNIFGLAYNVECDILKDLTEKTGGSCLFVKDSGNESALA